MQDSRYKSLVWYPILAVGISMVGFICIKTGRDGVFFAQGGLRQLPLVYILIAVASVPAGMMHLAAMKRWGARKARVGVFLVTAAMFLGFAPFVALERKILTLIMFALVPAAFAAVFAAAWLLAGDLLEGADKSLIRWAYSRIGAGSMIGGVTGGLLARSLASFVEPRFLVAVGAGILLLAAGIISRAHQQRPAHSRSPDSPAPKTDLEGKARAFPPTPLTLGLIKQPYIQGLIGISALSAIAALYIDFQFYTLATVTGHVDAKFFASFYTILSSAALVLQLVAAPWIQSRYGVGGALLVLPLALLGGAGVVLLSTTILSRSILKVTEGGLKASIHRSMWEQVFLPIGREGREMAKVLVDGVFARMSEGIAAVILWIWVSRVPVINKENLDLVWISWLIAAVILLWILLTGLGARRDCPPVEAGDYMIRIPDS